MTGMGHNSGTTGIAAEKLRSFVHRVENLNADIKGLNDDKSEVYAEAKALGFDVKTIKKLIQRRAMDTADRREQDELLDLYERAMDGEAPARTREEQEPGQRVTVSVSTPNSGKPQNGGGRHDVAGQEQSENLSGAASKDGGAAITQTGDGTDFLDT